MQFKGIYLIVIFVFLNPELRTLLFLMVRIRSIKEAFCLLSTLFIVGCMTNFNEHTDVANISAAAVDVTVGQMAHQFPQANVAILERGVKQVAALWRASDGTEGDFTAFCLAYYAPDAAARETLFHKLSYALEVFRGGFHKMSVALTLPVQLDGPPITPVDELLGSYAADAHYKSDMFANKLAFITILNFPNFNIQEKSDYGALWSRLEWAYIRMGDLFTNRLPASVAQELAQVNSEAENYIAQYNIMMGNLLDEQGQRLFPADMVLLSHWNLRDELKSNYAPVPDAYAKQLMIYQVMNHIVAQTIPQEVINNSDYDWAPGSNRIFKDGAEVKANPEGARRYTMLLNQFKAALKADPHYPVHNTALLRAFDGGMEMTFDEIEEMFIHYISSPQVQEVAALIKNRLGRDLQPFDIWFDGFKARSGLSEEALSAKTTKLYPTAQAYKNDIPNMLMKLGYTPDRAKFLASKIVVEAARGSGHAWGAESRDDVARLRTRLTPKGMDYKGFNIAIHEMGHNVEQTISLYDMDYYILQGVPNTAFTETLAFIFQKRDLDILGITESNPLLKPLTTLDIFWGSYEIMGVALVDMYTWKWLYDHPQATANELKTAVMDIAKSVWNNYYAPVLGTPDSPLLAIYSHMIDYPLYLANYPLGHIIEFQLEEFLANKKLTQEIDRLYALGCLTPQIWMEQAVGSKITTAPLLAAVHQAVEAVEISTQKD